MRKIKYNIPSALMAIMAGLLLFSACEEEPVYEETRLFQPVLNEALYSIDNTIIVDMGKMKKAKSYTIEVSRDTFKTLVGEPILVDTNFVVIEDLLWNRIYQVRAQAHAENPELDSKVTMLGNVKTKRYPSTLNMPAEYDVTDTRARLTWVTVGQEVTTVKVFTPQDERLENPIAEFEVSPEEVLSGVKIITGLEALTTYQVALYSGDVLRGYVDYTTRIALPDGIDLSGLPGTSLADTLADVEDGAIIILEKGVEYSTGGYNFDKAVTIMGGYGFTPAPAVIECSSNFNIMAGANIGHVKFKDIFFTGDFGGNYVFNIDQSGSIGELEFDNCRIRKLRGILRAKGGEGIISKYTIINSLVDSLNGYAVMTMDVDPSATSTGWAVGDLVLKNSTFAKIQFFLVSRTNTNSILIEDCTIFQAPEAGRQLLRWRGSDGNNNVTNGITIQNTIIGPGWAIPEAPVAIDGFDGLGSTTFNVVNSYVTADYAIAAGKDEIPGFTVHDNTAEQLWVDPVNLDFNIEDTGFAAKNSAGDPRWRPGL